jgi:hypothetical protein
MCVQFSPAGELRAFFAVKRAFDPPGLLNPGKGIPTLRRCAEYGRCTCTRGIAAFPDCPGSEPDAERPPERRIREHSRAKPACARRRRRTAAAPARRRHQGLLRRARRAASRSTRARTPASSSTSPPSW